MPLLFHAMGTEKMESVLVFSRTKHGADKICHRLERGGIAAVAIHSNRTQGQRERALEGFKRGEFRVLVATDIAARGIDVTGISHVVNFDVPQYAEDYIHRIGRTGRAGLAGDAITLVSAEERQYVKRIEQFVGKRYALKQYPGAPKDIPGSAAQTERPARTERPRHGAHVSTASKRQPKAKPHAFGSPRKKESPAKMRESYSSGHDGGGWSNY
jgi:ATP-dependent RNA helicase RhlE